jgi:hypothetical protein
MGRIAADLAAEAARQKAEKRAKEKASQPPLHPDEERALKRTIAEAKRAGATLDDEEGGGLPASMVLGVLRRDHWRCKRCGGQERLSVHHKGHLENPSPKMKRLSDRLEKTDPKSVVTICGPCHDAIHDADRANVEEN